MSNEKYVNYYVEILTNTLTEAVVKNISLQANAKISEDIIDEQVNSVQQSKDLDSGKDEKIKSLESVIAKLNQKIAEFNSFKVEYDSLKNQVQHVDTFRSELVKCREGSNLQKSEHDNIVKDLNVNHDNAIKDLTVKHDNIVKDLNEKIEYLQLTPTKRKKIEEVKPASVNFIQELVSSDKIVEDGGSF